MDLKKPYTLDEQIKKLRDHGVVIADEAFARNVLQKVSYYRLSGYMLQYRISTDSHEMIKGVRFEDIYKIYCLRLYLPLNWEIFPNQQIYFTYFVTYFSIF